MSVFLITLDIVLMAMASYYIYWQSQIMYQSRYSFSQLVWGIVLVLWFVTTDISNWSYIIFVSIFILMSILAGFGGLGSKRLIATGMFQRVIPYTAINEITLTPLSLPNGNDMVVALFTMSPRRFVRLTFKSNLDGMMNALHEVVPDSVKITVQEVQ
ncbi:hypothetical protein [Lacticaseibacillus saniviri]|uniref:Uncharacterized protein n=1 Tax=Lacticaseibacillus saniviri JCM 17471 = DSM 24301 TaxID=1293598 RepID=A0A0R2MPA1_9LACO|nr:hypothetical protein [Lacticaseibacillus saniviri]KRO15477.1 hypothetical protein IV56_GL002241 [Lacticaseibacillus saniviri JCM 17471 = DSM 24301]MCG4281318.1 hypothetical protein [Lacticaseibacillus saniviri]